MTEQFLLEARSLAKRDGDSALDKHATIGKMCKCNDCFCCGALWVQAEHRLRGKVLSRVVMHGSEQSRRTGWQHWPAFTMLHFSDGGSRYLKECSVEQALEQAKTFGIDIAEFEARYLASKSPKH